jgi:hypothetical protein
VVLTQQGPLRQIGPMSASLRSESLH